MVENIGGNFLRHLKKAEGQVAYINEHLVQPGLMQPS